MLPPDKIKKILLIRPDMVGDVMLITPAISLLRDKYPGAKIDVWAQTYTRDLLIENKDISGIIIDPSIAFLKKQKYDAVINFFNELRYVLPTLLAGIPVRIGDRARILFGWMHNHGVWIKGGDLTKHQVEKNIELLKPLGITMPEPPPKLKVGISDAQRAFLNNFLKEQKIKDGDLVVGINPGIGRTSRAWLPERYAELIDYLTGNLSAKIIVTGTEKDKSAMNEILGLAKHGFIDLAGKTTLSQLIAVMSRYNLFISVDTGPLHIAAALGIPTVAMFPAKSLKPTEWGPWMTRHVILREATDCKRKCLPKKCEYDDCVRAITADEAISAVRELLAGGGNKTLEEARKDWLQKSVSVLTNHEEIYGKLKENDYHAVKLTGTNSLSNLIQLIIKEDINVIHWIGKKPSFILNAAGLLSSLFVAIPPLLIYEKEEGRHSISDLISLYTGRFKQEPTAF